MRRGRQGGWAAARTSLRRQYAVALAGAIGVLVLLALVCTAAVVSASVSINALNNEAVPLQVANKEVLQDITDAETGVRGYAIAGDTGALAPYLLASSYLPQDEQRLRALASDHEALAAAVRGQEQSVDLWLSEYVQPLLEANGKGERGPVLRQGKRLFDDVRVANAAVDAEIEVVTEQISKRSQATLFWTLTTVILLPLLLVAGLSVAARRFSQSLTDPLDDIGEVLTRLRAGDLSARAEEQGPDEIRELAAALNMLAEENLRGRDVEAEVLSRLEEIDRVRTELISTVSHELRTPLTSIAGYLELLHDQLEGILDPTQASMMSVIRRNLDRLGDLISNLLALSRAEETQLMVEPVDMRGVASEVAGDIRLTAAGRDITVKTIQTAAPVVLLGDRSQLSRAVLNLVSNAVKFSHPGDTVEIRVANSGADALVEVVDEGIGIPASDLAQLGSRFYRASNATRAEIAGTGLGLRIVQTIVDRHDGTLTVESVEGEGTTASIRLPLSRATDVGLPSGGQSVPVPADLLRD